MSMDGPAQRSPSVGGSMPEELREHALASTVRPDYPEALAARDGKVDTDKDRIIVEGNAHVFEFDHLPSAPHPAAELQPYFAPLQHGALYFVHAVDLALFVAGLPDMTFVYDHAGP